MLSDEQIQEGFRAGGYSPEEVTVYTQAMRERIAELGALCGSPGRARVAGIIHSRRGNATVRTLKMPEKFRTGEIHA